MADGQLSFGEAWRAFDEKWRCVRACLEGLEMLWSKETPEGVWKAIRAASRGEGAAMAHVQENCNTPPESLSAETCWEQLEEVLEALYVMEEAQGAGTEANREVVEEARKQVDVVKEYLRGLQKVWPKAMKMISHLATAPEVDVVKKMEGEQKHEAGRIFGDLLRFTGDVGTALDGTSVEKIEKEVFSEWRWPRVAERIEKVRATSWKRAKEGLEAAATRAMLEKWLRAYRNIGVIEEAIQREEQREGNREQAGETLGDVKKILAEAWNNMRDGFEQWVSNQEAHLDNALASGYPIRALGLLNEILGEGEDECQHVEAPVEETPSKQQGGEK